MEGLWDSASSWLSDLWGGGNADQGPVSVPVTAQDEAQARAANEVSERARQDRCYEQQAGAGDYDPSGPYTNYCE